MTILRDRHLFALSLVAGVTLYSIGCNNCGDVPSKPFSVGDYVVTAQSLSAGGFLPGAGKVPQLEGATLAVTAPHVLELRYLTQTGADVVVQFGYYLGSGAGGAGGQGGGAGR